MRTEHQALEQRFHEALTAYEKAAREAMKAEEQYRLEVADAALSASGGNAEQRKANADKVTSPARQERDHKVLARELALHRVTFLKALVQGGGW